MSIRSSFRQALRRYGRAAVVTVHERLDAMERQCGAFDARLDTLDHQQEELAHSQTALLQSSIHLVESQARQQADLIALQDSMMVLRAALQDSMMVLRAALQDSVTQIRAEIVQVAPTRDDIRATRDFLLDQAVRQVSVETADYASTNPEVGLMAFLYSHLPSRKAIDVGAHIGEVAEELLRAGYEVYAFEPYPPTYARLTQRLNGSAAFHAFNLALGSETGDADLYVAADSTPDHTFADPSVFNSLLPHGMPSGLAFKSSVSVAVKPLADLHSDGTIPSDISLVKIDTEGYDLEVIKGMLEQRYAVVCVEFWDLRIPFADKGLGYTVESVVKEMRQRGYFWYIVLYRVWGENHTAFFCNHDRPVPHSWGNILFFQEREIFAQAQQWCAAVLPRTYFKAVPPSDPVPD